MSPIVATRSPALQAAIDTVVQSIVPPTIPDNSLDLIDFSGVKPDSFGTHDFYQHIVNAINHLSDQGGGTLVFRHTKGPNAWVKQTQTYRIRGPIVLKSNIELLLHSSIRLFFEFDPASYCIEGQGVIDRYEGTTVYTYSPCIRGFNVNNVAIRAAEGNGAPPLIDGDGERWEQWATDGQDGQSAAGLTPTYEQLKLINNQDMPLSQRRFDDPGHHFLRPTLIGFFLSNHILIEGVNLTRSPFWVVHPVFCEHVIVRSITFNCYVVNNDGIDPESCRWVLIENVVFGNHDDNVAIKSGRDREAHEGVDIRGSELDGVQSRFIRQGRLGMDAPSEDIVIRNCVFRGHYAFCLGSEVAGGARNIYCVDNLAPQYVNMGVFVKSSRKRGGWVRDIYVDNLIINRTKAEVICLNPNYDNDLTSSRIPAFSDIHISNVRVEDAGQGVQIFGWSEKPIERISLSAITVKQVRKNGGEFMVRGAREVVAEGVSINGRVCDGTYSHTDDSAPPQRI